MWITQCTYNDQWLTEVNDLNKKTRVCRSKIIKTMTRNVIVAYQSYLTYSTRTEITLSPCFVVSISLIARWAPKRFMPLIRASRHCFMDISERKDTFDSFLCFAEAWKIDCVKIILTSWLNTWKLHTHSKLIYLSLRYISDLFQSKLIFSSCLGFTT